MDSDSQDYYDENEEDPDDSSGVDMGMAPIFSLPMLLCWPYIHVPFMVLHFPLYAYVMPDILYVILFLSVIMEIVCRSTVRRNRRIAKNMLKIYLVAMIVILIGMGSVSTHMQLSPLVPLLKIDESIDLTDEGWEEDKSGHKSQIRAASPLIFRNSEGAVIKRAWKHRDNNGYGSLTPEQLRTYGKELGIQTITEEKCDEYKNCTLIGEIEGAKISLYSNSNDHLEMILTSEKGGAPLTHKR